LEALEGLDSKYKALVDSPQSAYPLQYD
jgi:hypothetical protein